MKSAKKDDDIKRPSRLTITGHGDKRNSGNNDITKILTVQNAYREIYHMFHDKLDYVVRIYCPKQFEALRKLYCGTYNEFLQSVFTSDIWKDNSGGKSASTFFKSFDNKYVLKAVE